MKTCIVKGCGRKHTARGLCCTHYSYHRATGFSPDWVGKPIRKSGRLHDESIRCIVPGCKSIAHTRGYCQKHYCAIWDIMRRPRNMLRRVGVETIQDTLIDTSHGPEEQTIVMDEVATAFWRANEKQRKLLCMYFIDSLTSTEIGALVGLSGSRVGAHIREAIGCHHGANKLEIGAIISRLHRAPRTPAILESI